MNIVKNNIAIIFTILLMASLNLSAQLNIDGYENKFIDDFRYGLFVPPDYNPDTTYHLMLWLHGSGWLNDDDHSWYSEEWQKKNPTIVLTPKCNATGDGWGKSIDMIETPCIAKAFQALDSTKKYYNIDTTRMHIAGASMGGIGTFYVLSSRPGMFASAYIVCGGGDTVNVENLLDTPIWIFHGDKDNTVNTYWSWNLYQNILKVGGKKARYTMYRGVGHNAWDYNWKESTLEDWLFAQQLGSKHDTLVAMINDFAVEINEENKPDLNWTATSKPNGIDNFIWAYQVYRNDKLYVTVDRDSSHFTDLDAEANSTYRYSIAPMNYFFYEAERSDEIQITTNPETNLHLKNVPMSIKLYPNPVKDVLQIKNVANVFNVSYQLYSIGGQLLMTRNTPSNEIDISSLNEGVYLIHFTSNKERLVKKIIKL